MRAAGLAGAAVAAGVASSGGGGADLDERAFRAVNRGHGPRADGFFLGVTELGSIWASVAAGAVLVAAGRRPAAAKAMTAASAAWLIGQGLKKVFDRPRPYEATPDGVRSMIGPPAGASWPSTHPAVLLAFVTVAGRELGLSRRARAALAGLGGTVAASRVYLGVHYPADVAGGLLLGRAVADALSADRR